MSNKVQARVLIVDDDEDVLRSLQLYLKIHFEEVVTTTSPQNLNELISNESFELLLLDMNFRQGHNDGREGLYWLKHLKGLNPDIAVILMTAYGSIDLAVESLKLGASEFIVKPWENQKLLSSMLRCLELQKSRKKLAQFRNNTIHQNQNIFNGPLTRSNSMQMQEILLMAQRVAQTDANVLIRGENGTGKEVLARYIHHLSPRVNEPFVKVDLGALPENLLEAELFGSKKGAYTGSGDDRQGRFEAAQEGTLFLDEIGNMSLSAQQRLLSSIQNKTITPLGTNKEIAIDTRIISATNLDLNKAVADGSFRQDLFYRINTIELKLPALRERQEDIEDLANNFLDRFNKRYLRTCQFDDDCIQIMKEYSWPGNIRELEHSIERAVILSDSPLIQSHHFTFELNAGEDPGPTLDYSLEDLEKLHVERVLKHYKGNISKAAQHLAVNRNTLYRKMEKYGL